MRVIFLLLITIVSAAVASGAGYYYLVHHPPGAVMGMSIFPRRVEPTPTIIPIDVPLVVTPSVAASPSGSFLAERSTLAVPPTAMPSVVPTNVVAPSATPEPTAVPTVRPTTKPSPTPTTVPKPTVTPTPKPTVVPTLKPTSVPTPTVAPTAASPTNPVQSGLNADTVFSLVNDYRVANGFVPYKRDATTCSIAQQRAPQVYDELFVTYTYHAGFKAMNLPYWATETIVYNDTEEDAVQWWIDDLPHRQVLLGNYIYSCAACYGNSCSEVYTSFIPK